MHPQIECKAGYSACDYPMAVFLQGQRREVQAILAEWRDPQGKHYRLLLEGGQHVQLHFLEENDWQIQMAEKRHP